MLAEKVQDQEIDSKEELIATFLLKDLSHE